VSKCRFRVSRELARNLFRLETFVPPGAFIKKRSSMHYDRCRRDRRGTGTQELAIKRNDVRFLERRFRGERRLPEKFNAPRALEKRGVLRHRNSIRLAASKFNGPRRCNFVLERCHDASGAGRVRCRKGTARTLRALLCPKGQQKYPEKKWKEKKKQTFPYNKRTFPREFFSRKRHVFVR